MMGTVTSIREADRPQGLPLAAQHRRANSRPPAGADTRACACVDTRSTLPCCCPREEDCELKRVCELRQLQFVLTCEVLKLERPGSRNPHVESLPELRASLAGVIEELQQAEQQQQQKLQQQQQQQQPTALSAQHGEH